MTQPVRLKVRPNQEVDPESRRNFENLERHLGENSHLTGFQFIEFETTTATDNLKIAHGLGFVPRDIVKLKVLGAGVTFNHNLFDSTFIDISTAGAARVRCLVGTYNVDPGRRSILEEPEEYPKALPVGSVIQYPRGAEIPDGWLLMENKTYSRAEYPALFSVIGDEFAVANDNSSQFRLPTVTNGQLNYIIKHR